MTGGSGFGFRVGTTDIVPTWMASTESRRLLIDAPQAGAGRSGFDRRRPRRPDVLRSPPSTRVPGDGGAALCTGGLDVAVTMTPDDGGSGSTCSGLTLRSTPTFPSCGRRGRVVTGRPGCGSGCVRSSTLRLRRYFREHRSAPLQGWDVRLWQRACGGPTMQPCRQITSGWRCSPAQRAWTCYEVRPWVGSRWSITGDPRSFR